MKNKKFKKRERRKILWIKLKSKKEKWERRRRRKKNRVILKNKPQSFTYFTNSTIFLPIILMAHSNALSTNTERKIKSFASFNDIFKLSKKKKNFDEILWITNIGLLLRTFSSNFMKYFPQYYACNLFQFYISITIKS